MEVCQSNQLALCSAAASQSQLDSFMKIPPITIQLDTEFTAILQHIGNKLQRVIQLLENLEIREEIMSKELDALKDQVAENTSVEESAVQLLQNLSTQIQSMKDDPVALENLAAQLHASSADLAAAIAANTPAATSPE